MKGSRKVAILFILIALFTTTANYLSTAPKIILKGASIVFNDVLGYPFIDQNNRTMVPLRICAEAAGAKVGWDNETNTAIVLTESVRVEVPIGSNILYVNGVKIVNDTVSIIRSERTYLPIKAVMESIGYNVSWDNVSKTVVINSKDDFNSTNFSAYDGKNLDKAIYGQSKLGYVKTANSVIYMGKTYKIIKVDGGDLNGIRLANVAVDIGYGSREYWGLTNEFGQLVYVLADEIVLQDDYSEPVNSDGRYYDDEAKVPGTEKIDLDEGHVIADSLGGVANAYNITPQDSVLNQSGDQAYMEKWIRDAGGCLDFFAVISYPNSNTQIPSKYRYTYKLNGELIIDEFENKNPDGTSIAPVQPDTNEDTIKPESVAIIKLDKKAEYITIKNNKAEAVDLTGWRIRSVKGDQWFTFPKFSLNSGKEVVVGDSANNTNVDFHWLDGRGTWNNNEPDPAELYDSAGNLIDKFSDY